MTSTVATGKRIDVGRLVMLTIFLALTLAAVGRLSVLLQTDFTVLRLTSSVLTLGFYSLLSWAYFRRGSAKATTNNKIAWVLAPVATFFPFIMPFFAANHSSQTAFVVGNVLLISGLVFSVYSVWALDKNLSVVPQARGLVDRGPYSIVRHPLYLGEVISVLGLVLVSGGLALFVCWIIIVVLQCYRAREEEKLLSISLEGYVNYKNRTACVIPGIY